MSNGTLGRYQIIREIARSNDIVYEARDPVMGRRVAIKELALSPSLTGQARRERIDRFFREAKAAGSLSPHPHIVTIYEVGQQGDRYFIAMEYLEGRPLRDILQMEGPLPVDRALHIALQVCEALDYAHARGVIHRDIKPDNIHILPGDVVKLTDFGIARITADPSITADGQVFGTPSYMSPEQVAGKPLDARTDIFSLGITLYEMLTGRKPFMGDTMVTITYNIMHQEPAPMAGVPPELQQVVLRAMAKSPDDRFRSAAEMREALLAAARARQVPAGASVALASSLPPSPDSRPLAGGGVAPGTSIAHAPGGPEPTAIEPPPLYVPRFSSGVALWYREHQYFLSRLALAAFLALLLSFLVWIGQQAYQNYQIQAREAQAAVFIQKGVELFNQKRYQEATAQFAHAAELAPGTETGRLARQNAAASQINLGNDLLQNGRATEAVQAYQRALEFDPRSPTAHFGLGMAYHELRQIGLAIREWRWVIENAIHDPVAEQARLSLGWLYLDQGTIAFNAGQPDRAFEYWERCIELDPTSEPALRARQLIERFLGSGLTGRF